MREEILEERGIAYRANEFQAGRQTLVFIHGLSGSCSAWYPYEERFEKEFNVLTFDLRGHGKSQKQFFYSAYSPELMADDLVVLLKHAGIDRCVLIGHSFGTLIALSAIKEAAEKFSAVVFLSPTYGASKAWWLPFGFVLAAVFGFLSLLLPFNARGRGRVDYSKYVPTSDWSLWRIVPDIRITSVRVYTFCMRQIYSRDTDEWWKGLTIPALVIHGERDSVISSRNMEKLRVLMPHAKFVILENGNHVLAVNNVDEVAGAIEDFAAATPDS